MMGGRLRFPAIDSVSAPAPSPAQAWTPKKLMCYAFYRLCAKHLPDDLGPIGAISARLRRMACRPLFRGSARVVTVGRGADFGNGCNVVMEDHANLGAYALVDGSRAVLTIGRHVMMGKHCTIILQNHKYLETGYDGFVGKDVLIGEHAWIGHHVVILPGVTIGAHAIIGAGSVVSKDVPDYAVAAGNPARVKKLRKIVTSAESQGCAG